MEYKYTLTVESEFEEEVCSIEAGNLESLMEQLRKVEHAIKRYEADKEVQAQLEIDRQQEEGVCGCGEPLDEKEDRCPECEATRVESHQE